MKRCFDWYFRPKFFEKNGTIYKFLGVELFRWIVPTFGVIACRLFHLRFFLWLFGSDYWRFVKFTKIAALIRLKSSFW